METTFAILKVFFLLIITFQLISLAISITGGWFRLAKDYKFRGNVNVKYFFLQSGHMNFFARYSGVLTIGANNEGLMLSILPIFRLGHPTLFIPWSKINVSKSRSVWGEKLALPKGVNLHIHRGLAKKLSTVRPDLFKKE